MAEPERGGFRGVSADHPADRDRQFKDLVARLTTVHDEQQSAIQQLNDEVAILREQLLDRRSASKAKTFRGSKTDSSQNSARLGSLRSSGAMHSQLAAVVGSTELAEISNVRPEVQVDDQSGTHGPDGLVFAPSPSDGTELDLSEYHESQMTQMEWPIPGLWADWLPTEGDVQRILTRSTFTHFIVVEDTTGQRMTTVHEVYQRLIIRPNSALRLFWDLLSSLMVCYDVVTIPLMAISLRKDFILAGGTGGFTDIMDYVTTTFWSVDVWWSFLTGFHSEGLVEMRAAEVAKHYMKTWFFFDMLILIIDWSIVTATSQSGFVSMVGWFRAGKTARVARILRTVRLLRFVKLQQVLSEALELINSETIRAFFNVALVVLFIFGINHYLACGWYLMGHLAWSQGVINWIEQNQIEDSTTTYAYFTALHWSLTQFTPASMEIRPYNLGERVYSIVCLVFALVTFSSFLGSITASITQLRKHSTEASKQKFILRSYFMQNKISSSLSKTIWSYLMKKHFCHQTRSHKAQVEILKLLPPHLQGRLHQELYGPYITRAPFFYHYVAFSSEGLMEVCLRSITELTLYYGESLFMEGKVAEKMYFTASGYLYYEHPRQECARRIGTGSWISEAALWVKWVHVATLSADTSSEIIALDSAKFRAAVSLFKHSFPFVQVYAHRFHQYLEALGCEYQTDLLTDVGALEGLTRSAWFEVCSAKERSMFSDMPKEDFPRISRNDRFRSVLWHRPAQKQPHQAQSQQQQNSTVWRRSLGIQSRLSNSSSV